jgi:trk system potassium uptake protein TrkA
VRIVVVGAGEVGTDVAVGLAGSHDVVVVDIDPERTEALTYAADVLAVTGDGTDLDVLERAGVDEADLLVASTDDDEVNLAICGTARTVCDAFTIGRVRSGNLYDTWLRSPGAFGVDFMLSTDLLAAQDVVRVVGLPAALDVDPFAGGNVQMAEFEVTGDSAVAGATVATADCVDAVTFAAVLRDGDVVIPTGDTAIAADDRLVVIGPPEGVRAFARVVAPAGASVDADDVVVVGGTRIGYHVARLLEERGLEPRLVERDADRARALAESLPDTVVYENDATDVEFLAAEGLDRAEVLVAATDSAERNLLVSLLASTAGVGRTIAIVEGGEYVDLFEAVGVDVAINPREATAEEIVRFTQGANVENLSLVEGRRAEVLEIEVDADSALADRPIREAVGDLPAGVVIGAITRGDDVVTPRGDTVIRPGDHAVIFVAADALPAVIEAV